MEKQTQDLIKKAYAAFNARDIDVALSTMHPDVQWPKAFEGGYVEGHDAIRKYWTRQFKMVSSNVIPLDITNENNRVKIKVHQVVHDLNGGLLADEMVTHFFTLRNGKVAEFIIGEK